MNVTIAGEGEAVLLGHSYLWDAAMWAPQIAALSRSHRIVAPDLWGHGGSGRLPHDATTLEDLAAHHLALMDSLGIERFAVVGLSIGGMWGAELALMAPDRVSALVLLDTFAGAEPAEARAGYRLMMEMVGQAGRVPEALVDKLVGLFISPDAAARQPDLPATFRKRLGSWDRQALLESVVPLGQMFVERRSLLAQLPTLAMPALVVTGSLDVPRPVHEGREMAAILGCEFVEVAGAGHISSLEAPDEVNRILQDFLRRHRGETDHGDSRKRPATIQA
ncbi:alpha/beta fold hydrolase [Enterovirga sp. DB1703]|uniref:Alpha/beta fold hydrolase n=2 Tax=Enterovirga aerilata TaxID=2730920 RepID=A0A849I2N4_9HYPH|nr:alpha/beta fold hydrolase [Enterovirga sp. DB1703]